MKVFVFRISCHKCKTEFVYKIAEKKHHNNPNQNTRCIHCGNINNIKMTDHNYKIANV